MVVNLSSGTYVILAEELARLVRPSVISAIHHGFSREPDGGEFYKLLRLAEVFAITPREVGFAFADWDAYVAARRNMLYPERPPHWTGGDSEDEAEEE